MIDPGFSDWPWQPLKAYSGPESPNPRHTAAFMDMSQRKRRYSQGIGPMPESFVVKPSPVQVEMEHAP